MSVEEFDLVILGGGNSVALGARAAKAGLKVAVIEKDRLGGTCPNRGCIPSKLLIGYATVAASINGAERFHIDANLNAVDADTALRETRAATSEVTDGKIAAARPDGLEFVRGYGRFVEPRVIEVDGRRLSGKIVVIATGGRPHIPPIPGGEGLPIWSSDDVFELDAAPESIVIVGGGYIACELAFAFTGLGVKTTMLVRGESLLEREDRDIRAVFQEGFADFVDVRYGASIKNSEHDGGRFQLAVDSKDGPFDLDCEALLAATGRRPNSGDIGLEAAGVATGAGGTVSVDGHLRTNVDGVWAMGDVKGGHVFTHAAAWESTYLGDRLLDGKQTPLDYGPMPHAVFSHPEIAGVGLTEDEIEAGTPYVTAQVPYTSAAKGRAIKERHGLCKLIASPSGELLGAHIVGAEASILIHEIIPAMKWRNHVTSLTEIIHIHPSLSEVVRNCARKLQAAMD